MCGGFSPLFVVVCLFFTWCYICSRCRGEYTGRSSIFKTLVLPLWTEILNIWWKCHFAHFEHFVHFTNWGPRWVWWYITGVGYPYTMYIYSLRHFLTTKGALIDGDGYPPKNPKNDPKKVTKMTKNWLKLSQKKCQKVWFLMAKSSFSLFFIQLTQKSLKIDQKSSNI